MCGIKLSNSTSQNRIYCILYSLDQVLSAKFAGRFLCAASIYGIYSPSSPTLTCLMMIYEKLDQLCNKETSSFLFRDY